MVDKMSTYTIQLPNFEGPLDLLLFFIKRDELNIYDIPIAKITGDFLEYIRLMELFDLELAGEFMVMAASLMQIKALMLLPRETVIKDGELEEIDPRAELLERLLIYKQFKESASVLYEQSEAEKYHYYRNFFETEHRHLGSNDALVNASLSDLMRALKKALHRNAEQEKHYAIEARLMTVEDRITEITLLISKEKKTTFYTLINNQSRMSIVVTFLALLDLVKQQIIRIHQQSIGDNEDIVLEEYYPIEQEPEHNIFESLP